MKLESVPGSLAYKDHQRGEKSQSEFSAPDAACVSGRTQSSTEDSGLQGVRCSGIKHAVHTEPNKGPEVRSFT